MAGRSSRDDHGYEQHERRSRDDRDAVRRAVEERNRPREWDRERERERESRNPQSVSQESWERVEQRTRAPVRPTNGPFPGPPKHSTPGKQRPSSAGPGSGAPSAAGPGIRKGPAGFAGSLLSSLKLEAKKLAEEKQAKQVQGATTSPDQAAAAAAVEEAPSASGRASSHDGGGESKKRKHEPIVWHSPKRQATGGASRPQHSPSSTKALSLHERLALEQEEFKRQQQEEAGGEAAMKPSPSPSGSEGEPGGAAAAGSRWGEGSPAAAGAKQPESSDGGDDGPTAPGVGAMRSRWLVEETAGGQDGDIEEGEAPAEDATAAAELAEQEALNRRELEDLEPSGSGSPPDSSGLGDGDAEVSAGLPYEKSMLEECRSVDEYERCNRISEGTYGVVYRAREKRSGKVFALKKIKLEQQRDGFPQTSIREINVLLSLHHPNIVNVSEVVVGRDTSQVFMVMEFVDHDLKELLSQMKERHEKFSQAQVKCLLKQLLEGVAHLHEHWVIHRDLKTSNLLYSNSGFLKICDFGLARQYGSPLKAYTGMVVTLFYRAIDRLLGLEKYSTALDMWSVGCIMAELLSGEILFRGEGELPTIKAIFELMGTPVEQGLPEDHPLAWPGWRAKLPGMKVLKFKDAPCRLREKFGMSVASMTSSSWLTDKGYDLLLRLLAFNPENRISAKDALQHPWFSESPEPTRLEDMPAYQSKAAQG